MFQGLCNAIKQMVTNSHIENVNHILYPYIPVSIALLYKNVKGCKDFYKLLKSKLSSPPNENKWHAKLDLVNIDWKSTYKTCFRTTSDTNLQWFQYRLLHRILPVRTYLKTIGINEEDHCSLCGEESEDIQHLVYYCNKSRSIWENLEIFISNKININITFNIKNVLFGEISHTFNPLNIIILVTKYYLYSSAKRHRSVNIFALQYYLKDKLMVEKYIAYRKLQSLQFTKKWGISKEVFNIN
jgi:hypothetical protein